MKTIALTEKSVETKARKHYISVLCNSTGLITSVTLIGYFLIMVFLHLYEIISLSYFNVVILLAGILIAFSKYNQKKSGNGIYYLKGLKMGFHITILAVIPFAVFMGIYLTVDTDFMDFI